MLYIQILKTWRTELKVIFVSEICSASFVKYASSSEFDAESFIKSFV